MGEVALLSYTSCARFGSEWRERSDCGPENEVRIPKSIVAFQNWSKRLSRVYWFSSLDYWVPLQHRHRVPQAGRSSIGPHKIMHRRRGLGHHQVGHPLLATHHCGGSGGYLGDDLAAVIPAQLCVVGIADREEGAGILVAGEDVIINVLMRMRWRKERRLAEERRIEAKVSRHERRGRREGLSVKSVKRREREERQFVAMKPDVIDGGTAAVKLKADRKSDVQHPRKWEAVMSMEEGGGLAQLGTVIRSKVNGQLF
ncbi:hypothetical protein RHMOL_Rhmol10G0275400 [Rhododendron molle]|uniref:Uncharacterized protein n=1 Tax=Rhododendron molle TaxID=49168 RepID=A0ACC0M6U5_RHOML|nr:hypothetical protein RHMOL_Rhmol10G0275400 [Rhododendron molle]